MKQQPAEVTPQQLATWMKKNNKSALYVADQTGASLRTVERFLDGETHPIGAHMKAFRSLMTQEENHD